VSKADLSRKWFDGSFRAAYYCAVITGNLTISIDLELAWGNWDNLESHHIDHVERLERPITSRLIKLFDRHEVPVTWAFVAALLDPRSARGRPGEERLWYAPDVIEMINKASVRHDLGSHGGHHRYFDELTIDEADEELAFAKSIHQRHGLSFESFVFPRNKVAKTHLLEKHGLRVFRGEDSAWHQRIRTVFAPAGRAANFVDKTIPIAPETVLPKHVDGLMNVPGSLLFFGRQGLRRFLPDGIMRRKLGKGLEAAATHGRIFHLWFHPSNFWHEPETQFALFESFIAEAAHWRDRGALIINPMAAFA